jgi:hypothetical protein
MASAFQTDEHGPYVEVDPGADIDYSVTCWVEGLFFTDGTWEIVPNVAGVPYNAQINASPVTIDGVTYAAGKVASAWIKDLQIGVEYVVTLHATFTGGRKDDRSFRMKCRQK